MRSVVLALALLLPAAPAMAQSSPQHPPGGTEAAWGACYARSTEDCLCWPATKLEYTAAEAAAWRAHECQCVPCVSLWPAWLEVGVGFVVGAIAAALVVWVAEGDG